MEHIGYILGKNIQLPNYLGMLVEGEDLTEIITLKIKRDDVLDDLIYYITYKNADGDGDTISLTKELTDKEIKLSFVVTDAFTAVKGKMEIQVTGFQTGDEPGTDDPVWKSFVSTIVIARALHPEEIQPDVPTIFVQYLAQMEAEKLVSEGFAKGTQEGVPVTSESPYYHDNAKYWKEQAKIEADYAETEAGYANTSRNEAMAFARKAEGYALGEQDGTPVGPGSPYYENNAEYFAGYAADQASEAHDFAVDADNARISSVSETESSQDGGTNVITITYKDGTVKTFTVKNGHTGSPFAIYKTYSSIAEMNADLANVPEGKFVCITSTTEDPDNAKLYVRGASAFTFITDLSGAQGIQGPDGLAATIQVGTVTTGQPGSQATVTNSGTTSAAIFDFSIPKGATGATGAGVAAGGTAGQILVKNSGTNYDTKWANNDSLKPSDVVDSLTSSATNKPLSANQGRVLNGKIADIEEVLMGEHEVTVSYPNDTTYASIMPDKVPSRALKFAEVPTIVGKTRAWNQLASIPLGTQSDVTISMDSDGVVSLSGTINTTSLIVVQSRQYLEGHKYLIIFDLLANPNSVIFTFGAGSGDPWWTNLGAVGRTSGIITNKYNSALALYGLTIGTDMSGIKLRVLTRDLTLIFGSGNEPSTVAEALAQLPALGEYDAYDAGSLVSTEVSGVKSVGVNLWDEVKNEGKTIGDTGTAIIMYASSGSFCPTNQIPCKPNTTYKFIYSNPQSVTKPWLFELASEGTDSWSGFTIAQYVDSGYSFTTSANAKYITFACFDGITNIQLCDNSLPDAIKTTYHPYKTDTLSLPSTVTLKSAGSVAEVLTLETGKKTRPLGSVDLSTLEWVAISNERWTTAASFSDAKWPANNDTIPNFTYAELPVRAINDFIDSGLGISINVGGGVVARNGSTVNPPTGILNYEKATPLSDEQVCDPVPYNFLEVEGGGTVDNIQEQSPVIDNCLDVTYDIIPQ